MDLTGDGIKEASKMFQQAGWVFEHMRTLVTNLNPSESSCDFTSESLGMLTNLMLAQAQYLFYKKAMEAGMKPPVLAKISMQVGDYFKKAFELSLTNTGLKNYDSSKFSNVMQYHYLYFQAMSYNVIAMDDYKKVAETSQGMGKAVSMFKATMAALDKAKPVSLLIPSNY
jgi:hypothetical protein